MRRHIDPKRKTTQAEDNPSTEDPHNPDSRHNRHKHGGAAPVMWRCTRYVAVHPLCGAAPDKGRCTRYVALHPLRGGAPEQKRCIAYGSGAVPQQTRKNAELARRTTHRRTPPCATGPYWRQDGHAAHATTCTPAHSSPLRPNPTPPTPLHAKSRFSRPSAGLQVSWRPGRAAGCRSGPAGARGDHASRGQARAARAAAATTGH